MLEHHVRRLAADIPDARRVIRRPRQNLRLIRVPARPLYRTTVGHHDTGFGFAGIIPHPHPAVIRPGKHPRPGPVPHCPVDRAGVRQTAGLAGIAAPDIGRLAAFPGQHPVFSRIPHRTVHRALVRVQLYHLAAVHLPDTCRTIARPAQNAARGGIPDRAIDTIAMHQAHMPLHDQFRALHRHRPDFDDVLCPGQQLTRILPPYHALHRVVMRQFEQQAAAGRIPDADKAIISPGHNPAAVIDPQRAVDRAIMAQPEQLVIDERVPHPRRAIRRPCQQAAFVPVPDAPARKVVMLQSQQHIAAAGIPDQHRITSDRKNAALILVPAHPTDRPYRVPQRDQLMLRASQRIQQGAAAFAVLHLWEIAHRL